MKQSIQTTQLVCDRARVYLNLTCNPTLVFQSWWLSVKATIFYFDCTWEPTWLASQTTKAEAAHNCGRTQVSAFLKAFQVIPGCEKVWEGRKDLKLDQVECCPESLIEEPWKVPCLIISPQTGLLACLIFLSSASFLGGKVSILQNVIVKM